MRNHGSLTKWNDERGFGFIAPANGAGEVFVHISAFPRDGKRPEIGELISYKLERTPDGKTRAVQVMRPGQAMAPRPKRRDRQPDRNSGIAGTVLTLCAFAVIAYMSYARYTRVTQNPSAITASAVRANDMHYSCDGRTMCSQMTSCAEATYFIQHCPGTKMDGDGDGEPCEQQWCNDGFIP